MGNVINSLGEYAKAKKYYEKALALRQKIGFKENEALCYPNLGSVCNFLGQHDNAKEHLEKWGQEESSLLIQKPRKFVEVS